MRHAIIPVAIFAILAGQGARARGAASGWEDQALVSNGQGISSPSFWEGLQYQNPAGLSYNQQFKIQGSAATFEDTVSSPRAAAGVLGSIGAFAGGVEYARFGRTPYESGTSALRWGGAVSLNPMSLRLGITGHHRTGADGDYHLGLLFDPSRYFRLGLMVPSAQNGVENVGAGITIGLDRTFDFVLDGATNLTTRDGVVKPGLTLHSERFTVSGSYGFRYRGASDPILSSGFSGAIGIRFSEHILLEYGYRGLARHLLGLTLR